MIIEKSEPAEGDKNPNALEDEFKSHIREDSNLYMSFVETFKLFEPIESPPAPVETNSFPRWDKVRPPQYKITISLDVSFRDKRGEGGWFCGEDFIEFRQPGKKSYFDELNQKWGTSAAWSFFSYPFGDSRNREYGGVYRIVDVMGKMGLEFELEGYEGDDAVIRWRRSEHPQM